MAGGKAHSRRSAAAKSNLTLRWASPAERIHRCSASPHATCGVLSPDIINSIKASREANPSSEWFAPPMPLKTRESNTRTSCRLAAWPTKDWPAAAPHAVKNHTASPKGRDRTATNLITR